MTLLCRACLCQMSGDGTIPVCRTCYDQIQEMPIEERAKTVSQLLRDAQHDEAAQAFRRLILGYIKEERSLSDWDFGRN